MAVPTSLTVPPPSTVVGMAVAEAVGAWFARTVTSTFAVSVRAPARSSVTVRVRTMFWRALVFGGAVQVVSRAEASSKIPPPLLLQVCSRGSPSGSLAVPRSVTMPPPFTVVGVVAVAVTSGARLARTVTWTVTVAARSTWPSSVTVRVSVMLWEVSVFGGAVHVVSGAASSSKVPPPLLLQR